MYKELSQKPHIGVNGCMIKFKTIPTTSTQIELYYKCNTLTFCVFQVYPANRLINGSQKTDFVVL